MGQIKRHKKQYKKSKPIQKKTHTNSKFKHRGSTTVEQLKKQIELDKAHLQSKQEYENEMLGAVSSSEEEEEVNHFNDLVQNLSASVKKKPAFKEKPLQLLGAKKKSETHKVEGKAKKLKIYYVQPKIQQFKSHLNTELSSEDVELLINGTTEKQKSSIEWPEMGQGFITTPEITANTDKSLINEQPPPSFESSSDLESVGLQPFLANRIPLPLNHLQSELLTLISTYKDVYYPYRNFDNAEQIRQVYTIHALNHIFKTRACVMLNSKKIEEEEVKNKGLVIDDMYRDQGLARPKVLIVTPFRDSAYRIVNIMAEIIKKKEKDNDQKSIMNMERFINEFTGNTIYFPKTNPKPDDYEKTFSGNTDDNFRIGISLTKKTLKLYTDFYASDILIGSPLGLRLSMGGTSDHDVEADFLSSIEVLILDQAELFLAQNWENLLHVIDHMHLQPKTMRATDINRVRSWCLNGFSKFYRQTLLFTSHELPEFRGVFNNKCFNYEGSVRFSNPIVSGDIRNVIVPLSQVFHRIECSDIEQVFDIRFKYFVEKILPQFRSTIFAHCMIYVPNYFDFIQLRNYFKAESVNFVQICEYTKKEKVARARDMFFHSGAHFLLYSERSHFFKRTRIKGIRHIIMYQPPQWPNFYSEMINLMHTSNQNSRDGLESSMSITVLYTKYDCLQLNGILGSENATNLLESEKTIHVYAAQ
ncbi:U3 small nucleolar RNA-associated protein 25 homolog [Stomoxys calcitrans]|uniref:U3 small nucleolar RNA-associated protein 25 homolog n=1 Tax=Stomoxys calcitrans TaxID=35570 RepID=UPI0027E2F576|nr:U3 small nucleolar RNA-associated protein 25 homolog [Stomoxys calcitrans]